MRFLFVDRILDLVEGKSVRGIKHITADCPLIVDQISKPYFIPSLIGETLGQLTAWNVMTTNAFKARPVAGIVHEASLKRPAFLGETILLESFIDQLDDAAVEYHSTAYIHDEPIFTIEGALGPLLPMTDFIDDHLIRTQFKQIYRPGVFSTTHEFNSLFNSPTFRGLSPESTKFLDPADKLRDVGEFRKPEEHPSFSFDRILNSDPGVSITAQKHVSFAAPYFPDHFPNQPVLPLTILLECIRRLALSFIHQANFNAKYRLHTFKKIKMKTFVHPGDLITSTLSIKEHTADLLTLSSQTELEGKRVCVLELTFLKEI